MIWTDELKQYALDLVRDGHSASAIARQVNERFRLSKTRNAIIGLAHRNGLRLRGDPVEEKAAGRPRTRTHKVRRPRKPPLQKAKDSFRPIRDIIRDGMPIPSPKETDIPRVSFLELGEDGKSHCKWPCVSDPRETPLAAPQFCGEPRLPGLSYCEAHTRRAYAPPQPRRPAPAAPVPQLLEKIEELPVPAEAERVMEAA